MMFIRSCCLACLLSNKASYGNCCYLSVKLESPHIGQESRHAVCKPSHGPVVSPTLLSTVPHAY